MRTALSLSLLWAFLALPVAGATAAEHVATGEAAYDRGDFDAAAKAFESAVALEPGNAKVHYTLGTVYGRQAQKASLFRMASLAKKAKQAMERAVELDPDYIEARFGLLEYYLAAPGFAGGSEEKAAGQAAEIRKRDALAGHRAMARIYSKQKKPDLARKEYVDAVREQPNSAKAHYFLGVFLMNEKNWSGSLHELEMAQKLDPAFMPAYFRLGQHAARSEINYARGEEFLRKYLAYKPADDEPQHANAWYWLGQLQEKQGRKAEAKTSYANALKLAPASEDVKAALKRVS
jgi:cytochrome c-type biogenesis protein CcmH/NrfG